MRRLRGQEQRQTLRTVHLRGGAEGSSATVAAVVARSAGSVRVDERRRGRVRQPERPLLPLLVHKLAAEGGAVPDLEIRPVYAAEQHHGNRQHLRARGEAAVLGGRVGPEHPVLPGPAGDGPGRVAQASLERVVRAEREPMLDAAPCGAFAGGGRSPRVPDGGGPRGRVHGPHQDLSGASREAEGAARRLRGIQLPESHRPLHHRRVRIVGRGPHRVPSREVAVRPGGVLQDTVSEPADEVRQAVAAVAVAEDGVVASDRAAVLRPVGREDADRDADQGHAVERQQFQLAVHVHDVTFCLATASFRVILSLSVSFRGPTELRPSSIVPQASSEPRSAEI
ncbi:COUP transcription factor 2 isoform X1 [Lasioglossum baleicum]|uniref:COUP transcription factor 2 isoform X1 n=1 Tax=Lasioglossum baleicum TaxID=434251 RepID=UPI003FCDC3B1